MSVVTTSTAHLGGVSAANGDAVAAGKSNALVGFRASATAHDAVASTVSLGRSWVEIRPGFTEVRLVIKVSGPEAP